MGCATGTVKYILFLANLVFALAGLALLVTGIIYKLDLVKYEDAYPQDYKNLGLAPVLIIVLGSIIFFIAFLGCCGAIRESTCMLTSFAVILIAIFILQIAVGTFAFLQTKDSDGDLKRQIRTQMTYLVNHYNNTQEPSNEVVDLLQRELKCCGSNGPSDYVNGIPETCKDPSEGYLYNDGCADKFYDFVQACLKVIGWVAIGIAATEIISAVFALCLASSIRNETRRRGY